MRPYRNCIVINILKLESNFISVPQTPSPGCPVVGEATQSVRVWGTESESHDHWNKIKPHQMNLQIIISFQNLLELTQDLVVVLKDHEFHSFS